MNDDLIFAAIDRYNRDKNVPQVAEGIVRNVEGNLAWCYLHGASSVTPCVCDPKMGIAATQNVLLMRPMRRTQWVVVGSFPSTSQGNISSGSAEEQKEIARPGSLTVKNYIGQTIFRWAAPAQRVVAFEVQASPTGEEVDAVSQVVTRGSYYISDSATYIRIRSIATDYTRSGWTEWAYGEPLPFPEPDFPDVNIHLFNYRNFI